MLFRPRENAPGYLSVSEIDFAPFPRDPANFRPAFPLPDRISLPTDRPTSLHFEEKNSNATFLREFFRREARGRGR